MSKEVKKLRKLIPVEDAVARWREDPAYLKEYDALEEEFAPRFGDHQGAHA